MIAALDVHYDDVSRTATAAAVVFANWADAQPAAEYTIQCTHVEPYIPGEFYRRELPCLLSILKQIPQRLDAIVIDGYVSLGDKPGLGLHLWEAVGRATSIIGVAKTEFREAVAVKVVRGESQIPLLVTAAGVEPTLAANWIVSMAGPYRIPDLLRCVDQLSRTGH